MKLPIELLLLGCLSFRSSARHIEGIDEDGLNRWLQEDKLVLAAFTSYSVESLQPFHDAFEEASQEAKITFATIDCDEEKELCTKYKVNAYPAVRLLKRGNEGEVISTRYRGKRTRRAIVSFAKKAYLPPVTHLQLADLKNFKEVDNIVIIAYVQSDQESVLLDFKATASLHHQDFVFGYVTEMPIADAEGLKVPSIVSYKADGDNRILNGPFGVPEIETFLRVVKDDIISEFSERYIETYMSKSKLTAYIFVTNEEDGIALRRTLTSLAKTFQNVITFGLVDAVEYAPMAKSYGLIEDVFPALVVHAPMNDNVFLYKQGKAITAETTDIMLRTILQAKATNGQVFGTEEQDHSSHGRSRDEL